MSRNTDFEPRTHEEVRLTQLRHDSYLQRGHSKKKVKESFKASGIKDSCAFSKLDYFDVVDGYLLDGMHIFSNVVALHHSALLGGGWSANVQLYARAFQRNVRVVCQRPASGPSPWALSTEGLRKAQSWLDQDLRLPRSWGPLRQNLLKPTRRIQKRAKKLKASAAVTATSTGLLATLATWNAEDNWNGTRSDLQYARFLGEFALCTRELVGPRIVLKVIPKFSILLLCLLILPEYYSLRPYIMSISFHIVPYKPI